MLPHDVCLFVPAEIDLPDAETVRNRLIEAIAAAPKGSRFCLDITGPTSSGVAIQLAEACRRSLVAAGRPFDLGVAARAVLQQEGATY